SGDLPVLHAPSGREASAEPGGEPEGRCCTNVRVSAKRPPRRSTRSNTSSGSNDSGAPPAAATTSCHVAGVETVGRSFARSEYGALVVLCRLFCDQSTNTLPGRNAWVMFDTTLSGCCFSSRCAIASANDDASSCVHGLLSGT